MDRKLGQFAFPDNSPAQIKQKEAALGSPLRRCSDSTLRSYPQRIAGD
jgi:hypothetical protein